MTSPAWMPPRLPEVVVPEPEPRRPRLTVVTLGLAVLLAFGLGAAGWRLRSAAVASDHSERPLDVVDQVLDDMVMGRWEAAFSNFHPDCIDFTPEALRNGFEPVLLDYQGHDLSPLRRSEFAKEEIVIVFGELDLGQERLNSIRAEFVFAGAEEDQPWNFCGLRIDAP